MGIQEYDYWVSWVSEKLGVAAGAEVGVYLFF